MKSFFSFINRTIIFPIFISLLAAMLFQPNVGAQTTKQNNLFVKESENIYKLNEITINTKDKTISFPCKINMNQGLIEVVLCTREGKTHESLLVSNVTPPEFQTALLLLGLDPVNEVPNDNSKQDTLSRFKSIETPGDSVVLYIARTIDGKIEKQPVETYIYNESLKNELKKSTWLFRGAATHISGHIIIDPEVTLIATYHDPEALMELNSPSKYNDELFYVNKELKLKTGEPVSLIIETIKK